VEPDLVDNSFEPGELLLFRGLRCVEVDLVFRPEVVFEGLSEGYAQGVNCERQRICKLLGCNNSCTRNKPLCD